MITADLVSRIALFAKLPEGERASLAARAADIHLRQDELLLAEGQAPSFYGILEGSIDVLKDVAGREERIFTYGTGDSFGELPLLLGSPVFANLRAAEPCRLLRLEGTDFLQLVSQCQVLSSEVTKTLVARVNRIGQFRVEHPGRGGHGDRALPGPGLFRAAHLPLSEPGSVRLAAAGERIRRDHRSPGRRR